MAIKKIIARKARLDAGIQYILNGDKTEEQILTARLNCDPGWECREMLDTKRVYGKTDGVQYYHVIQSFKPGEVSSELALEIAKEFAQEHLPGYEAVIAVHVDRQHIHAHTIFNSVNADTGEKYHSTPQTYYSQIRAISDRLCREHGLSVIMEGEPTKAVSYIEWLRQSRDQPTFRSMLDADLRAAIESANDLGHFFLLMEHMGYEIYHGNRLGFRLRGQDRFMYPGRKNPLFTEDGIQAAIEGNLAAIDMGLRPTAVRRPAYQPYRKHPKYTGLLALYVHYTTENDKRSYYDIAARKEQFIGGAKQARSIYSKRIICGKCGTVCHRKLNSGKPYWVCNRHNEGKELCAVPPVPEASLTAAILRLHNKLVLHGQELLQSLLDQLREIREMELRSNQRLSDIDKEIANISGQNLVLIRLKSKGCIDPALALSQTDEMNRKLRDLRRLRRKVLAAADGDEQIQTTEAMLDYLETAQWLTEVTPELFENLVERVTVISTDEVKFRLLNGLELTERLV